MSLQALCWRALKNNNNNNNNNNINKNNNNNIIIIIIIILIIILAGSVQSIEDHTVTDSKSIWIARPNTTIPTVTAKYVQKAWDTPITTAIFNRPLDDDSNTLTDLARLRAAVAPHSGAWFHAPPITAVSLRLSDKRSRSR